MKTARESLPSERPTAERARAYGLNIVRTIEIVDVSGAAVLSSPEMQELLRLMESPDIHGVVTKEFSRLMRPEKFTDYALLQAVHRTQLCSTSRTDRSTLASKSGRLLGTVRAAMAGMERQEIVEPNAGRKRIHAPSRKTSRRRIKFTFWCWLLK